MRTKQGDAPHACGVDVPAVNGDGACKCGVSVLMVPVGPAFPSSVQELCYCCVCGVCARVVLWGLVLAALGCSRVSPGCPWAGGGI